MKASGAGKVAAEASNTRRAPPGLKALGLGRGPASNGSKLESRPHIFTLSVPFPAPLHAGIALSSLAPDAEPHQRRIGKELTTSGSTLDVRWVTQDVRLLRVSALSFLELLTLVAQTMQRFGPPVSR